MSHQNIRTQYRAVLAGVGESPTVAELAAVAGLERAWFTTCFRRLTGLCPREFRRRLAAPMP